MQDDSDISQLQALTTEERSALVRKALQREDLSLCAFDDALAGELTPAAAIAEVLGLGADERDGNLASFMHSFQPDHGATVLSSYTSFVQCINAYAAIKARSTAKVNNAILRSTIKWHVQLQRVRARHVITATSAPDDIMSFKGAVADGHATLKGVRRQSIKFMPGGLSIDEHSASSVILPSPKLTRQQTASSFSVRLSHIDEVDDEETAEGDKNVGGTAGAGVVDDERVDLALTLPAKSSVLAAADAMPAAAMSPMPLSQRTSGSPTPIPGFHKSVEMGQEDEAEHLPLPSHVVGSFSCHGMDSNKDKINQDCACIVYPCAGDERSALFVVLDGHGDKGDVVSQELLHQLYERISGCISGSSTKGPSWDSTLGDVTLSQQLTDAFEAAHSHLRTYLVDGTTGEVPGTTSGAAAVAMVLRQGRVLLAHSGDCRAVMGTHDAEGKLVSVELTHDHKLENPEEKARIEAAGGWIKPSEVEPYFAPARVYKDKKNRRLGPGLTMSRSLGDLDADEIGVIATPEVAFYSLAKGRDRFIVLASDGVWEFLSSADVVNIVGGFLSRGEPAINAARFLIAKAAVAWASDGDDYRDDITAIVIFLDSLPGALGTA